MSNFSRVLLRVNNAAAKQAARRVKPKQFCHNVQNATSFILSRDVTTPAWSSLKWIEKETRKEYHLNAEQLKKAIDNDEVYLVDVREPSEVEAGRIPAKRYIHLPIGALIQNLLLPEEDFLKKFGVPKPGVDEDIVFSCKRGIRSSWGFQVGREFGYNNCKHYLGGWEEWASVYPESKI